MPPATATRDPLSATFAALADPTRRAILTSLTEGESSVTALAEPFDMTLPAVSKHLKVLERAGLLSRDVQGRVHRCEIDTRPLDRAQRWVERVRAFWDERFDDLSDYLDELQGKKTTR